MPVEESDGRIVFRELANAGAVEVGVELEYGRTKLRVLHIRQKIGQLTHLNRTLFMVRRDVACEAIE